MTSDTITNNNDHSFKKKIETINGRKMIHILLICTHIYDGLFVNDFLCELRHDVLILELVETIQNRIDIGDSKHTQIHSSCSVRKPISQILF